MRVAVLNDYPLVVAGLVAMLSQFTDVLDLAVTPGQWTRRDAEAGLFDTADLLLYDTFATQTPVGDLVDTVSPKVVVFTDVLDPMGITGAFTAGVAGYVYKGLTTPQLVQTLLDIDAIYSPVLALGRGLPRLETAAENTQPLPGSDVNLSEREAEIIALICRGMTNDEIAAQMYLGVNTFKTYVRTAYRKTKVNTRSQAVLWGARHGLASPPSGKQPPRCRPRSSPTSGLSRHEWFQPLTAGDTVSNVAPKMFPVAAIVELLVDNGVDRVQAQQLVATEMLIAGYPADEPTVVPADAEAIVRKLLG